MSQLVVSRETALALADAQAGLVSAQAHLNTALAAAVGAENAALLGPDPWKWLLLIQKYGDQVKAWVNEGIALGTSIATDLGLVHPATAASGLFGGGRVIGLIIQLLPLIQQLLASSGGTTPTTGTTPSAPPA